MNNGTYAAVTLGDALGGEFRGIYAEPDAAPVSAGDDSSDEEGRAA